MSTLSIITGAKRLETEKTAFDSPYAYDACFSSTVGASHAYTIVLTKYIYDIWSLLFIVLPACEGWRLVTYAYDSNFPALSMGINHPGRWLLSNYGILPLCTFYTYDSSECTHNASDANRPVLGQFECPSYGYDGSTMLSIIPSDYRTYSQTYTCDATEVYYYGYRYYVPETGRWASRDPLGDENIFQKTLTRKTLTERNRLRVRSTIFLYSFVRNAPTSFVDPFGLDIWACFRPTSFGFGNHEYIWNDKTAGSCGTSSSSG